MPRRLLLALLVLVAAPLVLLGWVSATAMATSQERARDQLRLLLRSRLVEIDRSTAKLFDDYARSLTGSLAKTTNVIEQLQQLQRTVPVVRQGLYVSSDGLLLYPERPNPDDPDAVALYAALPGMISGRSELVAIVEPGAESTDDSSAFDDQSQSVGKSFKGGKSSSKQAVQQVTKAILAQKTSNYVRSTPRPQLKTGEHQWQVWYMDQGMQLILWLPREDGAAVGIVLERPRWTSDLTAALPDSIPRSDSRSQFDAVTPGFTALVDEAKQIVYRWGDEGDRVGQPAAVTPMSAPLSAWQWEFHSTAPLIPQYSALPLLASLAGIGIVLLGLGVYVLTGVQRQMRAARNRVSFAGQVSHELRTPLTNIRLYAELAESDLEKLPGGETRDSVQRRLSVIDTETRRLSRLVSGVLEMIRGGKQQRGPQLAPANPNDLIEETLGQFEPSFTRSGVEVHRDLKTDCCVKIDADIFEMVLVNLLSNVEKYAAEGNYVAVKSRLDDDELIVTVSDHGQGISRRFRSMVFRPFARLDDSINAPSGTGIGLTIARNAAIRHGGQLELIPSDRGACFQLSIPVISTDDDEVLSPPTQRVNER
ncbi:MAG: HAMP domain-containing histidine kinase [Pirellulaceae bacterium]|nr:HAMP domain-containing histidine kinase [Pirellulaceae bacterium]